MNQERNLMNVSHLNASFFPVMTFCQHLRKTFKQKSDNSSINCAFHLVCVLSSFLKAITLICCQVWRDQDEVCQLQFVRDAGSQVRAAGGLCWGGQCSHQHLSASPSLWGEAQWNVSNRVVRSDMDLLENSVEEGSIHTNISLQVPVFEKKLNGMWVTG